MSSHREAPEISKDPVADSTDLYAFVSPDKPDTVTIIANYVPLESPAGGPNFYEFGDDVLYEINIDNNGDGKAEIIYQFTFANQVTNANTFLYNTGPIQSLTDTNWNRRQTYTVTRVDVPGAKKQITKGGAAPSDASSPSSVIGVWTSASRQKARVLKASNGTDVLSGPYVQVSRLGNPLVNEVVVPMSKKDFWNAQPPANDKQFAAAVLNPELAQLL